MALTAEEIKALEQLRGRLSHLATSLATAKTDLERSDPVPSWTDLQRDAELVVYNLSRYQEAMNEHRSFLTAAHAYPLPNFPGHTQEGLLGQLMRKKLEPKTEAWVAEYAKPRAAPAETAPNGVHATDSTQPDAGLAVDELHGLWRWAGPTVHAIARPMLEDGDFADSYSLAEREAGIENVITGLRRNLDSDSDEEGDDDDEDEDEDGDEKMEDAMPSKPAAAQPGVDPTLPPRRLETMLRFTSTCA